MSSGGEGRGKRKGDAPQVPNEIRASKKTSEAGPSTWGKSPSAEGKKEKDQACKSPRHHARTERVYYYDSHSGKMNVQTPGSQLDSPVAEGKRRDGGGKGMRDLHKGT